MALAIVLALFLSLTIGLTFNASLDSTAQAGSANGSGAAAATGATPQAVDVTLTEFAISPADITVPAGVPVTFNVTNTGAAEHDFTIDGISGTETVAAGGTTTLEVDALDAGSYPVLCTIAGHERAGMTATVLVTDDAGAADAGGRDASAAAPGAPSAAPVLVTLKVTGTPAGTVISAGLIANSVSVTSTAWGVAPVAAAAPLPFALPACAVLSRLALKVSPMVRLRNSARTMANAIHTRSPLSLTAIFLSRFSAPRRRDSFQGPCSGSVRAGRRAVRPPAAGTIGPRRGGPSIHRGGAASGAIHGPGYTRTRAA